MLVLCKDCRTAFSFSLTASLEPQKKETALSDKLASEENGASGGNKVGELQKLIEEEEGGSELEASVSGEGRDEETSRGSIESSPVRKKVKFGSSEEGGGGGGESENADTENEEEQVEKEEKGEEEMDGVLAVAKRKGGIGVEHGIDEVIGERNKDKYCEGITTDKEKEEDMADQGIQKSAGHKVKEVAMSSPTPSPNRLEETKTANTTVCSGCLGLLDNSFLDQLSTAVSQSLRDSGYKHLYSFALSISTPLSLIIRQSAVLFYLKENFDITEEPLPAYVKETLRHKLYAKLKEELSPLKVDIESPFQVVLKFDHSNSVSECKLVARTWPSAFAEQRKRRRRRRRRRGRGQRDEREVRFELEFNIGNITNALSNATLADFEVNDFFSAQHQCLYDIDFLHSQVWIGGRYCKYSRELSQTPWFVDGVRKAETSVQELICAPIEALVGFSQLKFSSSGREDCDVRMLGNGRPFLIELINPKNPCPSSDEIRDLELEINSSTDLVEVKKLRMMAKSDASLLKEGETEKRKEYQAKVWTPRAVTQEEINCLEEMGEVVLQQKTPIRVLHRRAMAIRERMVYSMRATLVDDHHFFLHLTTQAGTYVKEFVHGDLGRTRPNLRIILKQDVDIISLDVLEVLLDWPPSQ